MLLKLKNRIINADHIAYAEWQVKNHGGQGEQRTLIIYFAGGGISHQPYSIALEEEEGKWVWESLAQEAQGFHGASSH